MPHIAAGPGDTWALSGSCGNGAVIGGKTLATCQYFVAKFNSDDSLLWAVNTAEQSYTLAIGADGSVVFGGYFNNTVDFGKGPLTSKGLADIFVVKLAATDGAVGWP